MGSKARKECRAPALELLLQFELYLTGKVERIYKVLEKKSFTCANEAMGRHIQPAKREVLTSAELLRRRQKARETMLRSEVVDCSESCLPRIP